MGNKLDLILENGGNREVLTKEAEDYAERNSMMYIETSALTHKNIKIGYYRLIEAVYKRFRGEKTETSFSVKDNKDEKKKCC